MNVYAVVLAGGSGTRLWPLSRRDRPKQLLPLLGGGSMLQATIARLAPVVAPERVFVLTQRAYVGEVRDQLPGVPRTHIVGEPEPHGTAASVALGAALVAAADASAAMLVLPADHVIAPVDHFHADLARAQQAARTGSLVTFGIAPTGPETGYGYIELAETLADAGGSRRVRRFVEKPDRATAEAYVASADYVWNSGMFCWTVDAIRREMALYLPGLLAWMEAFDAARGAVESDVDTAIERTWARVAERVTIDYGLMERSARVACVLATFAWSDVGSWSALKDVLPADGDGNVISGLHIGLDTSDSLIWAGGGRLVATLGLRDMVIVDTPDAVLVCPRDRAQEVRRIVEALGRDGTDDARR